MLLAQKILTNLVSFPVLGGHSNLSIMKYIKDYLDEHRVTYHLVPNEEGNKTSLHCRIGPAVDGGTILSGHTDVVPVEGQPWDTEPFVLTEKDGKLFGRGSCDMKGFIACCLAKLPEMTMASLKKPIYFAFSYDEEIGCLSAPELVQNILSTYTEKPKYAIIGEPSLLLPVVGQKGICVYNVELNGSAGHSSRIMQEVSAIHEASKLIRWLENKMHDLVAKGRIDDRFIPNHSSLHIGKFRGGIAHNVIADYASFTIDIRTIPKDDQAQIIEEFKAYCQSIEEEGRKRFPKFKITVKEDHPAVPALDTPEELSIVDLIKELSKNDNLQTVAYAAEAGQFAEGGFETVICGPGSIEQAHRANEFISKEQLDLGTQMIQRLIDRQS